MNRIKKAVGSTLIGLTIVGGASAVAAGAASAAPQQWHPGYTQPAPQQWRPGYGQPARQPWRPAPWVSNGQNPNWRPGPVFHQGQWHRPYFDAARHHWGFWLGPIWVPVG